MRKALWLSTIALALLSACSGRATTSPLPPAPPGPPSQIAITVNGALQYPSDQVTAAAKQGTYTGPFTYTSSNGAVLGLSLSPPSPTTKYSTSVVSPNGVVYIVAVGVGKASIVVTGDGGVTYKPPALQNVVIVAAPKVLVTPTTLSFLGTGSHFVQTVNVTQDDFTGSFGSTSDCKNVAIVDEVRNKNGAATYRVTPVAVGTCVATFNGGYEQAVRLPIDVTPADFVVVSPASLRLSNSKAADVSVTQAGFNGSFSETDNCGAVATVAEVSNAHGHAKYRFTAQRNGGCKATFTGSGTQIGSVDVTVNFSPVDVSPPNLHFTTSGSGGAQTVAVSQTGFTGSFAEVDDCSGIATISQTANGSGRASYSVVANGNGSCSATITGDGEQSSPLAVTVALPGPVVLSPTSLSFTGTGAGNAQTVAVSQTGFTGAYTESDDCTGVATIAASGPAQFTITPSGQGSCTAVIAGGNHESAPLPIAVVVPGGVTASPAPLNFIATGAANAVTVTVTQSSYSGTFVESDTCSGIATIAVVTNASGTATYLATPGAAGICHATFTGGGGQTFVLGVTVTQTGFGVQIRRTHAGRARP